MHTSNSSGSYTYPMRSMGWTGASSGFSWVDEYVSWTPYSNAIGGYPSLLENGALTVEVYPGQQVWSATDWSANPRTALGVTSTGEFLMVTVDGRSSLGDGLTSSNMGDLLLNLGAHDAIGLDGGGSTTMSIENCWINHIVNHPSDNFNHGHDAARSVSDGVYVY